MLSALWINTILLVGVLDGNMQRKEGDICSFMTRCFKWDIISSFPLNYNLCLWFSQFTNIYYRPELYQQLPWNDGFRQTATTLREATLIIFFGCKCSPTQMNYSPLERKKHDEICGCAKILILIYVHVPVTNTLLLKSVTHLQKLWMMVLKYIQLCNIKPCEINFWHFKTLSFCAGIKWKM